MLRRSLMAVLAVASIACGAASPAFAQQLLMHFPLDGTPQAFGPAAGDAKVYVVAGGTPPASVPGKFGQALRFEGTASIAMPFSLDPVTYPNVTVTAWVKLDPDSTGERTVFSAGSGNVPRLAVHNDRVNFVAARGSLMSPTAMPRDEWVFVAGVVEVGAARLQVIQAETGQTREGVNTANLYPPSSYRNPDDASLPSQRYVFVGSHGFKQWPARQMAIDDVRVYAGALSQEQVAALRSVSSVESHAATATAGGTANTGSGGKPAFYGGVLTDENVADLSDAAGDKRPIDMTYASEEEALAAAERREREAAEAELARQQNELEAQRRATEATESQGDVGALPYLPVGNPGFSALAGLAGDDVEMVDLEDQFIDRVSLRHGRLPGSGYGYGTCLIRVSGNAGKTIAGGRCISQIELAFGGLEGAVIGSIATCRAGSASDVGGVRITGHRIQADGTTIYVPATKTIKYSTGCETWSPVMLCPVSPEQLATGVVVHYRGENRRIVGLQLICRRVGVR